jgi:4-amino-4-deoxy-L-arabinose transferase-like glycosyltransferase
MTSLRRWLSGPGGGLLLVVAVAALLRYPGLDLIPPGLSFDEAGNGIAALDVAHGQYHLWWPIGGGKEPLIAYLLQPLFWLFGPTRLALRLYAATMGLITVAGTYWLAWELFAKPEKSWKIGRLEDWKTGRLGTERSSNLPIFQSSNLPIFAALGLATAFWHVAYSRITFRALAMPAVEALALAWLWRALRSARPLGGSAGRWRHFAGAGFLIGLGLYTYPSGRFVPVALVLFFSVEAFLARLRRERPLVVHHFWGLALSAAVALLVFSPLALFFARHPGTFLERAETVSIFDPAWNRGDLWGTFLHTTLTTLGAFAGLSGDPNPMGNLPGRPMLGLVLAPLFWLGVAISIWQVIHYASDKPPTAPAPISPGLPASPPCLHLSARHRWLAPAGRGAGSLQSPAPYLFLLCWWPVLLLPGILAPEGAPHYLRIIGTAPATYILIAIGLAQISNTQWARCLQFPISKWRTGEAASQRIGGWLILIFLPIGLVTARDYFIRWAGQPELYMAYDVYAVELVKQMEAETDPSVAYVIPMDLRAGHEARHYTLDFLYRGDTPYYYLPVDEATVAARLTEAAAGQRTLRVVRWLQDKHAAADEREVVTFLLTTTAQLMGVETYPVYRIETWVLPSAHTTFVLPVIKREIGATFGGVLQLEAANLSAVGRTVAVALRWAPLAAMDVDYKASLRLVAPDGSVVAQKDRFLRHNWHQGTSLWSSETVNEYYLLPPVPPGEYELRVVVYHPETLAPLVVDGKVEVSLGLIRVE